MNLGSPVVVVAAWSWFRGRQGVVVARDPLMVQLAGESKPLMFGVLELAPASAPDHFGGAE